MRIIASIRFRELKPRVFSYMAFAFTFLLIALMEIGDKTQFVVIAMATRTRRMGRVAAGATLGISMVIVLGVTIGTVLDLFIPIWIVDIAGAFIFMGLGLILLVQTIRRSKAQRNASDEDMEARGKGRGVFVGSALVVGLMEFGDKTQVATITLAATYDSPLSVALGAILAEAALITFGAFVGARLLTRLRRGLVDYVSSILFIMVGIWMILV